MAELPASTSMAIGFRQKNENGFVRVERFGELKKPGSLSGDSEPGFSFSV
jgi:hypothetical protein